RAFGEWDKATGLGAAAGALARAHHERRAMLDALGVTEGDFSNAPTEGVDLPSGGRFIVPKRLADRMEPADLVRLGEATRRHREASKAFGHALHRAMARTAELAGAFLRGNLRAPWAEFAVMALADTFKRSICERAGWALPPPPDAYVFVPQVPPLAR